MFPACAQSTGFGLCGAGLFPWLTCCHLLGHPEVRNLPTGQAGLDSPDKLSSSEAPAGLQACSRCESRGLSSPSSQRCLRRGVRSAPITSLCPVLRGAGAVCELQPHGSSSHVADPWRCSAHTLHPHPPDELFPPSSWLGRVSSCLRESGVRAQPVLTFLETLAAPFGPPGTQPQERVLK